MSDEFLPIKLPSRCLTYEVKPEDIRVRPYTGGDEVFLSEINIVNCNVKFLEVLRRVVQGIDPEELTFGDKLYLMVWQYINSYTEMIYEMDVCSHCMKMVSFPVDLREMDSTTFPEDLVLPLPIPITNGETLYMKVLTLGDEIQIEKYSQSHEDGYLYKLAMQLVDEKKDVLERMEYLRKSLAHVTAKVRAAAQSLYHGPTFQYTGKCPNCGEEETIDVPFRFEFLFPTGQTLTEAFGA